MKLKLDLHPIFTDGAKIEASLQSIMDEAVEKRAAEVEIIPGKGSGALKKTVLRFLDRPDVKARYHRIDKDSDNWGRIFVYFRHEQVTDRPSRSPEPRISAACVCCQAPINIVVEEPPFEALVECPSCNSPNRISVKRGRTGQPLARAGWGYE
jgi:hypothetical protein